MYRRDINITQKIPDYRRMLIYLTPTRVGATVYFTQTIDLTKTLPWIRAYNQRTGKKLTLLHLITAAIGNILHERPQLNRYICGHRVFQRDGVTISVSTKKELKDGAKVVLLKVPVEQNDSIDTVLANFTRLLAEGQSGKDLLQEKEANLILRLPPLLVRCILGFANWLDKNHWLPGRFVDNDPLYTSVVLANLGSIGLDAAYHHLYEYGNCPFFGVIGRVYEKTQMESGGKVLRSYVDIKWSFDERVDDGLSCALSLETTKKWLEDPAARMTWNEELN